MQILAIRLGLESRDHLPLTIQVNLTLIVGPVNLETITNQQELSGCHAEQNTTEPYASKLSQATMIIDPVLVVKRSGEGGRSGEGSGVWR